MEQRIEKGIRGTHQQLAKTGVLLALALSFQIGLMPFAQPVVGPLVNMTLLIATTVVGPIPAMAIGAITPLMAFLLGIMPLPILVPVVMLGNASMIIVYHAASCKCSKSFRFVPLVVAALTKFAVMALSIRAVAQFFMPGIPARLVQAFSLPQFYTALVGGVMALIILGYLPASMRGNETNDH